MKYISFDQYAREAKRQGYVSRAVFKLKEINERFRVIQPGDSVLDLGCAPGSWSQYASRIVGKEGRVIGIDILPVRISLENATFIQGDVADHLDALIGSHVDAVLSDMAPKTSGSHVSDHEESYHLCTLALIVAKASQRFVCKVFEGEERKGLAEGIREVFPKVNLFRPKATRKGSREIYIVAHR